MQFHYKNKYTGVNNFLHWAHGHLISLLSKSHCTKTQEADTVWIAGLCFSFSSFLSDLPQLSREGLQYGICASQMPRTLSQQVRTGAPPSTSARPVGRPCSSSQGTGKEGHLNCDEGRAKSSTCILKVAQSPVWFREEQHIYQSFPLIAFFFSLCTSFLQERHSQEDILPIPGVLCFTKLEKSSPKIDRKCMSTILIKSIYIMYF